MSYDSQERGELVVHSVSHLHGQLIVQHAHAAAYESICGALDTFTVSLRPLKPFTTSGIPAEPKRQRKSIRRKKLYQMMPVDQAAMNSQLDRALKAEHWETQPAVDPSLLPEGKTPQFKGDFVRDKVFVEVEFGNTASMYRDLFKFQVASRSRVGDVAVLIVATDKFARHFDSGVATFESAHGLLPYMAIGIQMPIWIIGIEPRDYGPIEARYNEMQQLCVANGLECHDYRTVFSVEPDPEPGPDSDGTES